MRIGVFICHCGNNISGTVDVFRVRDALSLEKGVVFSREYQYMCSENGQNLIKSSVADYKLDALVICSCSPKMHENTFRKTALDAGLNPYMVEIANIREQCSWIHKDKEEATNKATSLGRAAIAKVRQNSPLTPNERGVTKRALVIGGGIAGIETALNIADAGFKVDIVEKSPTIGGKMAKLDKTFPTLDCSACILTPKMVECSNHENINLFTFSEVEDVKGFIGNFKVKIRKKSRRINEKLCTGCGECASSCPAKTPNEFNEGLNKRGAVYIPFPQAVPNIPVIDENACIKLKTGKCGLCERKCPARAIDFNKPDEIIEEEYGAIVLATGFNLIDMKKYGEYGYGIYPDVVTSLEYERIMNAAGPCGGHLIKVSDGKEPETVVFISCVGSRDLTCRGKSYCSKICCMYTAKQAILTKEKLPSSEVYVFYIDVRAPGKNYDEFYRRAIEQYGVHYVKGMAGKVYDEDGSLYVLGFDLISNEKLRIKTDMVVLAAATESDGSAKRLGSMLSVSTDTNGFFTESHPKLRPVESPTAGVFLAGFCQGPKDIPDTVCQAGAAAMKVVCLLSKDKLETDPCTALTDVNLCSGCGECEKVCPFGAIELKLSETLYDGIKETRLASSVNEALCKGCGNCASACPSGAIDLKGFTTKQILSEIDSL